MSDMKLLFDLAIIQSLLPLSEGYGLKFHGGGLYGEVIFFALLKKTKNLIGIYDSKRYINPKILESGIKIYDINNNSLQEIVEKENIDVFYSPIETTNILHQILVKRYIVTFHGPRGLEMPYDDIIENYYQEHGLKGRIKKFIKHIVKDYLAKRNYKRSKARLDIIVNAKKVEYITVSEHSKYSIINFYPHLAKKEIPVFYSPFMEENYVGNLLQEIEPKTYFLLTSSARWDKNNLRAVWAFDELFGQRKDLSFKVVLTGVTDEKIFTRNLKNKDKFILLDYIDRTELLSLHKNAYAFIYPSLNEGFGYPPLESMRYSVPVAASGTSSIPEICQNAAIYFDPYNVSEIKNRIIQLLDKDIYTEYSARAIERYKAVSERQKRDLEKIVDFILGEKKYE
jgi:glycosyltransferase involved in cell wall biosynthesis